MPVGVVRIVHGVQTLGMNRVFDVQQDSIAGTRARRQANRRVDSDVVALICIRRLRFLIILAATGALITSMRNSAVFGFLSGASPEHPANSSAWRTNDVPET